MDLGTGSVAFALSAGMLAAVNPCGFALLPAYLSLFVLGDDSPGRKELVVRALRATAALTIGFTLVFGLFGLVLAPFAASIQRYMPGLTIVIGIVVAAAGLWVLLGRKLPTVNLTRRASGRPLTDSWPSMIGLGVSYAIASLSCTLAPFLAVVVTSFHSGSVLAGIGLFVVYALGMGLVVAAAATAVALARNGLVTTLRRSGAVLTRIGGAVLLVAGAYVAWYGVSELRLMRSNGAIDPIVSAALNVQSWLSTQTQQLGLLGFAVILAALVAIAVIPWPRLLKVTRTALSKR